VLDRGHSGQTKWPGFQQNRNQLNAGNGKEQAIQKRQELGDQQEMGDCDRHLPRYQADTSTE